MDHPPPGLREQGESPTAARSLFDNNSSIFELLFERSADAIWLFDPKAGVFLDCNAAAVELMRAGTKEKLLGARPEDLSPPHQAGGISSTEKSAQVIALAEERGSHRFEWVVRRFDGQDVPLEVLSTSICGNGRNLHVVFSRDISERKKSERDLLELNQSLERRVAERTDALATSEALFRAAFQGSPILSVIARLSDQKYVLANDAFVKWSGYAREEILGRKSSEFGIWASEDERNAAWADLRRDGSIHEREIRFRNRKGELTTVLISFEIIQINQVPHVLAMGLDITARKRAEEASRASEARLRELNELKSNFVSMVSHEFRTPLGIIQSSAELLHDFDKKMQPTERQEQLNSISRNVRRMAGMMEEILVLSRLDAGKLDFQPGTLDLNRFCRRLVDEILSATNRRCPIELSLKLIPSEARADERLLGHIFTNLLSNAVKYSEPGATVHFLAERDGSDVVCVIRDNGIGIPEEDQHQLFQAFHRGSNVGTRAGTGLGLLLVKRCADLHGGKVRIVSKFGEGTTVTVRFSAF